MTEAQSDLGTAVFDAKTVHSQRLFDSDKRRERVAYQGGLLTRISVKKRPIMRTVFHSDQRRERPIFDDGLLTRISVERGYPMRTAF